MTQNNYENSAAMQDILDKVNRTYSSDAGYVPAKWVLVEEASDTGYTIVHRDSGDIMAEDVKSHAVACAFADFLNEGVRINSERFKRLIELNLMLESEVTEYSETKLQENLDRANKILGEIKGL